MSDSSATDVVLSRAECTAIFERAKAFARGGGDTDLAMDSWWHGELRWARNRVSLASDRRDVGVVVARRIENGGVGRARTNQLDDASLEAAVRAAERVSRLGAEMGRGLGYLPPLPEYERLASQLARRL